MISVQLRTPSGAYPVLIGTGALAEAPRLAREMGVSRAALITDENVAPLWAEAVGAGLAGAGIAVDALTVPAGERAKSFAQLRSVLAFLERIGLDRHGLVVALGGGTIGDLAGFAAAVWLRGVRLLQVPTTLLAMVDSAIGGKTGINTEHTKNSVGAFWQPVAVISDLAVLGTLPRPEYEAAFAEVIKYAVAMDAKLALTLLTDREALAVHDAQALGPVVERCAAAKAKVVAADERESGPRAILNYGHTVGHAVEVATRYRAMHGRAVALGMRAAARIAEQTGFCSPGLVAQQDELLLAYGLPGRLPKVSAEAVLAAIPRDKKARAGEVAWVLPRDLGHAVVGRRVPEEVVRSVVGELLA